MRILFTGASSFTGSWFAAALAGRGHEVVAAFGGASTDAYTDPLRRDRVAGVLEGATPVWSTQFGDESFLEAIRALGPFDVLCHHGAQVGDYRSLDFDVDSALHANTRNARAVLDALAEGGCRRVVLTGSVFEGAEGAGSDGLPHLSAYGLSKALTAEVFAFRAREQGHALGKFVIPNPFGPREEARFTTYLARTWLAGKPASVRTPAYVRDNIHVDLLAASYADFVERMPAEDGFVRRNPSGYIESQGAFALRMASEMKSRLGVDCEVDLLEQTEFTEPMIRINTEPAAVGAEWDEPAAWDRLADFYASRYRAG